jgi:uncharacterized protein YkwD
MKTRFRDITLYSALALSIFLILPAAAHADGPITHQITLPTGATWCADTIINGLFDQINTYRAQNGVPALLMDTLGMKDAEMRAVQFAAYMATHQPNSPGFNPHTGYDTTAASIGYSIISENLAYMTSDPAYIVAVAWDDTLHINAMLAATANIAGVSCIYSSGTPYLTYEPGCSPTFCGQTLPVTPPSGNTPGNTSATPDSQDWAFLTLINNYRAQNGAGPLQVSAALENSSSWMSNDMATKNYASHTDSLGRTPGTRLAAFNYPYAPWGENIAAGFSDAQSAFNAWQTACDPDGSGNCTYAHRANMLYPGFQVIGIGRAFSASSTYGWYWTTDFGGVVDQTISPPAAGAPTITSFTATPSTITAGQASSLAWSVSGATSISISGIGDVSTLTSTSVSPGQTTTYTLTATNASGSVTSAVTVTVGAGVDKQAPTVPTLVSAVVKSAAEVDLTWTASTDNVGVAGYGIIRNGAIFATVPGGTLFFADTYTVAGAAYTYSILAYDAAGNYSAASNTIQVTTPGSCPAPATGAFTGCYYSNPSLMGAPALIRTDSQINFDWYGNAPAPAVPSTNFSVSWQGNFTFAAGQYNFSVIASDGMRVYIDGALVLNVWRNQAPSRYSFTSTLTQGTHLIAVQYYDETGTATAHLSWQSGAPTAPPAPVISTFVATPSTITAGQTSTLSWSVTGATTITLNNGIGDVSSLTSKSVSPTQTTTYILTASNSTGSVTGQATVTVNAATQPPPAPAISTFVAAPTTITAGQAATLSWAVTGATTVTLDNGIGVVTGLTSKSVSPTQTTTYTLTATNSTGSVTAHATVTVTAATQPPAPGTCPAPATGAFTGCYYNTLDLTGSPVFVRTDPQINFDWFSSPPNAAVSPHNFSVRWQGNFTLAAGNYTFTLTASDGMRVYIDGVLIFNHWTNTNPPRVMAFHTTLTQGNHLITVEYYEASGDPTAHVSWVN